MDNVAIAALVINVLTLIFSFLNPIITALALNVNRVRDCKGCCGAEIHMDPKSPVPVSSVPVTKTF